MSEKTVKKAVSCPCGNRALELRPDKVNSVGLASCPECEKHYLLLDSGDYWYDVIQEKYPRKAKCRCGCTRFSVEMEYEYRDNDIDIGFVWVRGLCSECGHRRKVLEIKIDYAPTENLLAKPLIPCAVPKLKYKLRCINGFWLQDDAVQLVSFLMEGLELSVWGESFRKPVKPLRGLSLNDCRKLVKGAGEVYTLAFGGGDLPQVRSKASEGEGLDRLWRNHEFLVLHSPFRIIYSEGGDMYRLDCATQFIREGRVVDKTKEFSDIVDKLEAWLANRFVTSRGKGCFDHPGEHRRLFGKKYS